MAAAAGLLLLLLTACVAAKPIVGTFTLTDDGVASDSTGCHGTGGFSDVKEGLEVIVKNAKSEIVGKSTLSEGIGSAGECAFTFSVPVPRSDFYSIEVGRRGALTYTYDELESRAWIVGFTLGS